MTLVIFDVDATLVYSDKLDSKCFAQIYQQLYGLPFPSIDWKTYPHVTDDTILNTVMQQHFKRGATVEEMETFKALFVQTIVQNRKENPTAYKIVPGAKAVIERLVTTPNFTIGIATGGWKAPAVKKLAHVDIPTQDLIISGADGKETRVQIIEEVLVNAQKKEIAYDRVVYVGDAIWDVTTTRQMGLPLVGIRLKGDVDFLQNQGVQDVLRDYQDIDLFMDCLEKAVPPSKILLS